MTLDLPTFEMRCERSMHGEFDLVRRVEWKLCRDCSKALSTPTMKRRVYHRFDMKKNPPERLKDIVFNNRKLEVE
jgi:hypothetical protein